MAAVSVWSVQTPDASGTTVQSSPKIFIFTVGVIETLAVEGMAKTPVAAPEILYAIDAVPPANVTKLEFDVAEDEVVTDPAIGLTLVPANVADPTALINASKGRTLMNALACVAIALTDAATVLSRVAAVLCVTATLTDDETPFNLTALAVEVTASVAVPAAIFTSKARASNVP